MIGMQPNKHTRTEVRKTIVGESTRHANGHTINLACLRERQRKRECAQQTREKYCATLPILSVRSDAHPVVQRRRPQGW
eukprot:9457450-Pyramimonas_sp.AAC.1